VPGLTLVSLYFVSLTGWAVMRWGLAPERVWDAGTGEVEALAADILRERPAAIGA
jgi:hypothetical protein